MIALVDERLAVAEASAGSKSSRHCRSSLVARGRASHSSNDVIVNPRTAVIEGKFAYGRVVGRCCVAIYHLCASNGTGFHCTAPMMFRWKQRASRSPCATTLSRFLTCRINS